MLVRTSAMLVAMSMLVAVRGGDSTAVLVHAADQEGQAPQTLSEQLLAEEPEALVAEARTSGDPARGALLFHQARQGCIQCHTAGEGDNPLGPDLARFEEPITTEYLVESILAPSKVIRKGYEAAVIIGNDGVSISGLFVEQRADAVVIRDLSKGGELIIIPLESIEDWILSDQSIMPAGTADLMSGRHDFIDLLAYLIEIAQRGPERAKQLKPHPSLYLPPPTAPDTTIDSLQVYRTMLPEAGPASLALGLGHNLWAVFDPQRGGLTYAWRGGFDLSPVHAQKINLPAILSGDLFYRESLDRPLRPADPDVLPQLSFRGYRLMGRTVELRYQLDDLLVRDRVSALKDGSGIVRRLIITGSTNSIYLLAEPQPTATVELDSVERDGGAWRIEVNGTARVTMVIRPAVQSLEETQ